MKPATVHKQNLKHSEGKCRICKIPLYSVLDVHRILPGSEGGKYTIDNAVVLCACCHRRIHDNEIIIDRWYTGTGGRVLRIIVKGEEQFV